MKRRCKSVDITDRKHIRLAVLTCLKGKWTRQDTVRLFCELDPLTRPRNVVMRLLADHDKSQLFCIVEHLTDVMRAEIKERKLKYMPARYRMRYDTCCAKWREIGTYDIKQQLYDYVAVMGLEDALRRIGEYQCASIPGRGQSYGIRAVRRWLRDGNIKYAWKGDVRQCFPSIERERLMAFLRRHVANEPLLWLVDELLLSMPRGLSIGSYLSQWLCNLYLSQLYHFISEECWSERRGKRIPLIKHALFYMDDILLLGANGKHMLMAGRRINGKLRDMGLELKPDWRMWKLDDREFIDIMGAKIYRHHVTIRARVFIRLRKTLRQACFVIKTRRLLSSHLAKRITSYFGLLKHTNSYWLMQRYKLWRSLAAAKEIVKHESYLCNAA